MFAFYIVADFHVRVSVTQGRVRNNSLKRHVTGVHLGDDLATGRVDDDDDAHGARRNQAVTLQVDEELDLALKVNAA